MVTCWSSSQCKHFPWLAMLIIQVWGGSSGPHWSCNVLSMVIIDIGLLLVKFLSLLQICAARWLVKKVEGVFAHFKDRIMAICGFQMSLDDRNIKLGYLFPEISSFMIRSELILPQFLLVLPYDARLLDFPDESWRWTPVQHCANHLRQYPFCILSPILLRAILWIGYFYRTILSLFHCNN